MTGVKKGELGAEGERASERANGSENNLPLRYKRPWGSRRSCPSRGLGAAGWGSGLAIRLYRSGSRPSGQRPILLAGLAFLSHPLCSSQVMSECVPLDGNWACAARWPRRATRHGEATGRKHSCADRNRGFESTPFLTFVLETFSRRPSVDVPRKQRRFFRSRSFAHTVCSRQLQTASRTDPHLLEQ